MSHDVDEIKARISALENEIKQVSNELKDVTASMRDVAETYRDLQGTLRVGGNLQKFALWCAKWGVVGVGVWSAFQWVVSKLPAVAP